MQRPFWSTIRGKLVSRTLLVVMVPLLIVGGVAVTAFSQLSQAADESVADARTVLGDEVVGDRARVIADEVSREIAIFANERLSDAIGWANERGIVAAAADAGARAEREGLTDLSVEELEELYANERQMGSPTEADLENNLAGSPDFGDIFFTNEYGYNVAASDQTSDFVQSDEDWWQLAWEHGIHIDEPRFDDSAEVFSVDISVRIDQGDTPVGVMNASLDVALVQTIADRFAADGYEVSVLERLGRFLANTENDHNPAGIMNGAVTASTSRNPRLIDAHEGNTADHPDGYSIDDEAIAGYSLVADQLIGLRSDTEMAGFDRAFDWKVVVEQPTEVGFAALAPLEQLSTDLDDTSTLMTLLLIGVALAAIVVAVVSSIVFSRRITGPIKKLRDAAVQAADVTLPAVVARIDEMGPDDDIALLAQVDISTGDEVEDLAQSFNTVQQTAADLAAEQARLRRQNVAGTFVSLGRRNQTLLSKQLEHISAMEQNESDSTVLDRLFQLDHLATRMRRNAESLLVLAGEETPRRFRAPVSMRQLVQAAGAEIEEFDRIEMGDIDDATVEGGAATDMAHLLAELLENASRFSPPTSRIDVSGRRSSEGGYALAITDEGLGMEDADLQTANTRLADPVEFDRAPSAYLGLFVVGHLARRHDLAVRLTDAESGGITATVLIPERLLVSRAEVASAVASVSEPVSETVQDAEVASAVASVSEPVSASDEAGPVAIGPELPARPAARTSRSLFDRAPGLEPVEMPLPAEPASDESDLTGAPGSRDVADDAVEIAPSAELADPWVDAPVADRIESADPWFDTPAADGAGRWLGGAEADGAGRWLGGAEADGAGRWLGGAEADGAGRWLDGPEVDRAGRWLEGPEADRDESADSWFDGPEADPAGPEPAPSGEPADSWLDGPDSSGELIESWLDGPDPSGEMADPWCDAPPARAAPDDPAGADIPGMPLNPAMPIAIAPSDRPIDEASDKASDNGPPPQWGREADPRPLFGDTPMCDEPDASQPALTDAGSSTPAPLVPAMPFEPPPPVEPTPVARPVDDGGFGTLGSYAEAMAEAVPASPPPPPPPPPPAVFAIESAPVVEVIESAPAGDIARAGSPEGFTPSGFRRRRRGQEGAPTPQDTRTEQPAVPRRDAGDVKASLARFRAGVAQGRAHVDRNEPDDRRDDVEEVGHDG